MEKEAPPLPGNIRTRRRSLLWNTIGGQVAIAVPMVLVSMPLVPEMLSRSSGLRLVTLSAILAGGFALMLWLGDICSGWWVPRLIVLQGHGKDCPPLDNTGRFWHVTSSPLVAWKDGVVWSKSRRPLFGPGQYTWSSFADACRYPKGEPPRGVVRIQLQPSLMHEARTFVIPHKATWRYVRATTLCLLSHRPINPPCLGPGLFRHATDIIIAPAQGMPWSSRQWIFLNTPATRRMLRGAQILYCPVEWH